MKKQNRKSLSILTFLIMSFVFMFAAFTGVSLTHGKVFATGEHELMPLNVKFISSHDGLYSGTDLYSSEIYFDLTDEKLVNESGDDLTGALQVKTDLGLAFDSWSIYNYKDKSFDVLGGLVPAEFDLDGLVGFFMSLDDEEQEAYYQNDTIVLHALAISKTTLVFDDQAMSNAKVLVGGVDIGSQITLNQASTYSIQAIANKYYHFNYVHMATSAQYSAESFDNKPVNQAFDYEFASGISDSYHISVNTALTSYAVSFEAVDEDLQAQDTLVSADYLGVLATTVKLDEQIANQPSLINEDSTDWKFVGYKVENQNSEEVDAFDTTTILTSALLDNYIKDGALKIYAVFTKLYKVQVSADDFGTFIVEKLDGTYQNITIDNINEGVFTYYVTGYDTLKITAMPDENCKFVGFNGVTTADVEYNVCTLTDFDKNYNVTIDFMAHAYKIVVAAVDSLNANYSSAGEIIEGYDAYISVYVNNILADSVVLGDKITMISTNFEQTSASHRFIKYQIYSYVNGWEELIILKDAGKEITANFISNYVNKDQVIYIRACFVKTFMVNIDIEEACAGRGYFNIKVYDKDAGQYVFNAIRLTKFHDFVDVNSRISIEAKPYTGYKFTQFTIPNTGAVTKNIITKDVNFEDLNFGIVFDKTDVELAISAKSENASVNAISSDKVQVGDKITFTYELNVGTKIKNVTINDVNIKKMNNVTVTDNAVIIDVTSEFLDSLGTKKTLNLNLETGMDGEFISMAIIIPITLAAMLVGAIYTLVIYLKARKKYQEIERREI